MRTIEFRGKRVDNGEWVYGYVDATMYKDIVVIHTETGTFGVNPETVGQFTGLHDKNGKEIYEGDVLKNNISDNPFGVVTWHNDGYFFVDCGFGKFPINANGYRPLGEMLVLKLDNVKDVSFEVIGNIHDNQYIPKGGEE